jgi:hypothetical protein
MTPTPLDLDRIAGECTPHYSDCDTFRDYNYGMDRGECDCTAAVDRFHLVQAINEVRALAAHYDERAGKGDLAEDMARSIIDIVGAKP